MNILIIEDEPLVARDLAKLVQKLEPAAQILATLESVETAVHWLENNIPPDLILADIQLSDGISFDIFKKVNPSCPIIFTTAYNEYALKAFKLNSIDYLLKPIDRQELAKALEKYKSLQNTHLAAEQVKMLLRSLSGQQPKYKERFLAVHKNAFVPVNTHDIALFKKEELIFIYTWQNQKYVAEQNTLEEVEHLLDPMLYFRINRQTIAHINTVGKMQSTYKGLSVMLKPPFNLELDISRDKAASFKKWLEG
ncbi:MAG: LytR/AlgR family response regulator transcription factor [Adhaeribacter sp.]